MAQEDKVDEARRKTLERELEWIRLSPRARQAKGKARINAYDALYAEAEASAGRQDKLQLTIPAGPRLGDVVVEADGAREGLRREAPRRRVVVLAPARRDRRRRRAERRRQDHAVPHDRRAGGARRRDPADRADGAARVRRPVARHARRREHRVRRDHRGRRPPRRRRPGDPRPGVRVELQLQGLRPAEARRRPLGWRAQPGAARQGAEVGREPAPARRADERPRRRHARGPSRTPCSRSRAARWSSATTAGSSTGSPPTCSPSRATPRCGGSRATSPTTRSSGTSGSAPRPISPTASPTSPSRGADSAAPLTSGRHLWSERTRHRRGPHRRASGTIEDGSRRIRHPGRGGRTGPAGPAPDRGAARPSRGAAGGGAARRQRRRGQAPARPRQAHRAGADREAARSRQLRRARHARPAPRARLRHREHPTADRRRHHRVGHDRRPQGVPLLAGLHRVRRRARRGVRREDPQGHGPRGVGRRAVHRAERRRRRPHPGRGRVARVVRRDLLPQREGVGRHPADQRRARPVRRRRRLLAGDDRLHLHGEGHVAHVHHRSRRREGGHRRGRHPGGARRRDDARHPVGCRDVRRRRRGHLPRRRCATC